MKAIELTQGKVAIVDDGDYEWLSQWKWHAFTPHKIFYAIRNKGDGGGGTIYMHRQILNAPSGMECDHINHDGLDNRRDNIRICTRMQNAQNMITTEGISRYKGVFWGREKQRWQGQITKAQKRFFLGRYNNEDDAALAYNIFALTLFGEYAYINNVDAFKGKERNRNGRT